MDKVRTIMGSVVLSGVMSLGFLVPAVQAQLDSLEPPGTAVNGNGDPRPTSLPQPSWDQLLNSTNGHPTTGCGSDRFTCIFDGEAVRDNATGLVWELTLRTTRVSWGFARGECMNLTKGFQKGWRLPSIHELASLVRPPNTFPALPTGHPFLNFTSNLYWSTTTVADNPLNVWRLHLGSGLAQSGIKADETGRFAWCVRGGGPLSVY